ncbi:P-loop containing nucleoside triphosphate hydrolase protein [Apiospora arundinis]|uniref:P-loop containing nucleoside triphosphate hydrolase protein n=1 Tax=Apiospora arundinis TaxID=335852 RepID=A0ABR2HKC1_9PEZI
MDRILADAQEKANDVLKSQRSGRPITYNVDLLRTMHELEAKRNKAAFKTTLRNFFKLSPNKNTIKNGSFELGDLLNALVEDTMGMTAVERSMASNALDILEAYYKFAFQRFIDNVAIDVIEIVLASPLIDVLSPIIVYKMDPALIRCVAGESEDRQALRAKLTKQLEILKRVAEICKRFDTDAYTTSDTKENTPSGDGEHTPGDDDDPPVPEYYIWETTTLPATVSRSAEGTMGKGNTGK